MTQDYEDSQEKDTPEKKKMDPLIRHIKALKSWGHYTMMAHFAGYISALDSGASSIMLVIYDLYCQSKLLIKI